MTPGQLPFRARHTVQQLLRELPGAPERGGYARESVGAVRRDGADAGAGFGFTRDRAPRSNVTVGLIGHQTFGARKNST